MRYNIVEGEPGIFPDPIARFYRWIVGLFGRAADPPRETKPHGTKPHGPEDEPSADE
ncbi:MAG: hypothetical protein JOZ04_05380 [Acidimicrobiia bacterium]|nr:hypothetical protein [Acidimicrobiia bacterium]